MRNGGNKGREGVARNIEAVKKMILNNRSITIRVVANDDGISFGSWQVIFTDVLRMKCAAAKIIPKLLNYKQKTIAQEMLTMFNDNPDLLKKVITVTNHGCNIETKAQSSQWKEFSYD